MLHWQLLTTIYHSLLKHMYPFLQLQQLLAREEDRLCIMLEL